MKRTIFRGFSMLIGLLILITSAVASGPGMINYQGFLSDSEGDPATGTFDLTFKIYDAGTGDNIIWQETHSAVSVIDGKFSVILGDGTPPMAITSDVFESSDRWLGVSVGEDAEISPRTRLVSVPYSHHVKTIEGADAGTIGGILAVGPSSKDQGRYESGIVVTGTDYDSVIICPSEDVVLKGTADDGLAVISMTATSSMGLSSGNVRISSSDAAKAGTRTVKIDPGDSVALQAVDGDGDIAVNMQFSEHGGIVEISSSDAAKNDPLTVTSSVAISPGSNVALQARDLDGDTLINLSTSGSEGSITLRSKAAKGLSRVEIGDDGIYFFDDSRADTTMIIYADGSIAGKGQLSMGQEHAGLGDWANVLGYNNIASGDSATVSGGFRNKAVGYASAIGGGVGDSASGSYSFVGGGSRNTASGIYSSVCGGFSNTASASNSFVGGGQTNSATGPDATASGGADNTASGATATVGGGVANTASGTRSTIAGGSFCSTAGDYAVIGGGSYSQAHGRNSVVCGGGGSIASDSNSATGDRAAIVGGRRNVASGDDSFIGGGYDHVASGSYSTVAGGAANSATSFGSTVGGGYSNSVGNARSVVSGGRYNSIASQSSCIPGGEYDTIAGYAHFCMAFGEGVYVSNSHRVMLYDGSNSGRLGINRDDHDGGASHPIHVGTNGTNGNGAHLTAGGVWTNGSSRDFKECFSDVPADELLEKLSQLNVQSWFYKGTRERHIGPIAEDFVAAFDVGTMRDDGTRDNKYISTTDVSGVALAAVKALAQKIDEQNALIEDLYRKVAELETAAGLKSQTGN